MVLDSHTGALVSVKNYLKNGVTTVMKYRYVVLQGPHQAPCGASPSLASPSHSTSPVWLPFPHFTEFGDSDTIVY
ncbi:hypothetical protein E2C01_039913 [Portunus trituberculatus]|uniref:Uncharacterized protein n=1 Tax=Portunus trituberculatus TaxID=210409 RepID=A0A5B7FF15_PORTR|nr:hypothetical protein [Portunus trituberculatus]